jgi:hypothetical protein
MRTVARTASKKIAEVKTNFTACKYYDASTGEMRPIDVAHAWQALESHRNAKLIESTDGKRYTVRVHDSLFYHLERPTA